VNPAQSLSQPDARRGLRLRRLLFTAAAALGLLIPLTDLVQSQRDDRRLTPRTVNEANDLWETVFTSGLGAGRSFANLATWREIARAQRDQERFRMAELFEQARRLQPRNPRVHAYLASRMLDNLAASAASAEEAWRWIESGRRYLDEALAAQPGNHDLATMLARIYRTRFYDVPLRMLRFEIAHPLSPLRASPVWRADAERLLAEFEALPRNDRERLLDTIRRTATAVSWGTPPSELPEYTRLPVPMKRLFVWLNQQTERLALLTFAMWFDDSVAPTASMAPDDAWRNARYVASRGRATAESALWPPLSSDSPRAGGQPLTAPGRPQTQPAADTIVTLIGGSGALAVESAEIDRLMAQTQSVLADREWDTGDAELQEVVADLLAASRDRIAADFRAATD
jgi:hypothetical protein